MIEHTLKTQEDFRVQGQPGLQSKIQNRKKTIETKKLVKMLLNKGVMFLFQTSQSADLKSFTHVVLGLQSRKGI